MKKILLLLIFGILGGQLSAQSSFNLSAGVTNGYNFQSVYLWKYEVKANPSIGFYVQAGYEYEFLKHFGIRGQLGFHQFYASATVNQSKVSGFDYNVVIPIELRYYFLDRWSVEAGVSIQNYRDFEDLAANKSNNLRTNLIAGTSYRVAKSIYLNFQFSTIVSKPIDGFKVKHYSHHILIGGSYLLGHKSTKPLKPTTNEK